MIILGLNTATNITQIALVEDDKVLAQDSWKSERNEAETLLPNIKKMLKSIDLAWSDIGKVAVIKGPGPFTALRISISVANAIAYALDVPVWGIPVQDFWSYRFDSDFVLQAGLNRVFYKGEIVDFEDLEIEGEITGHLKPAQIIALKAKNVNYIEEESLDKKLGEFIAQADYKDEKMVHPEYFAPPNITKSTKSYK